MTVYTIIIFFFFVVQSHCEMFIMSSSINNKVCWFVFTNWIEDTTPFNELWPIAISAGSYNKYVFQMSMHTQLVARSSKINGCSYSGVSTH